MEDKEMEKGVDQIFSFINILKIASDIEGFQKWLREYHKIEGVDRIFVGYKFFLEACVRGFIHSIIYSDSLDLEEDFVFFRARFVGVTLEDIPTTCEKTIFIKNIWNLSRGIREAREWEDMARSIKDFDSLFHAFDEIFRRNIASIMG